MSDTCKEEAQLAGYLEIHLNRSRKSQVTLPLQPSSKMVTPLLTRAELILAQNWEPLKG